MDKIYSRKRIKLPKYITKKRNKKLFFIFIILIISITVFKAILNYLNPMFDSLCNLKARGIAIRIINREAKESLENVDYNDLITIIRDANGNITMVKANVISINRIAAEITLEIQETLENEKDTKIYIPMGSFLGNEILYNMGPKIPISISSSGAVTTDFKSEFRSAGINQTIHRIYLHTTCRVNIVTPIKTISSEMTNEILVAENVIVGPIPDSYYNLEGLDSKDALEVVE